MRIPSSKTDVLIYFVALDATDRVTRETGLTGFTVYRSRNGGAATAYTTPTVAELSAGNMPGVYALTVDEDTTIASTSDSEEYCLQITQAAMAPVTRTIELYRRDTTTGRTLDVSADGEAGLDWANIGSPTTAVGLSGTTVKTATDVETDTQDIQGRLPAALVSGMIEASIGAMAAGVLTATAIAADAITDAKVASDVTIASVTGSVGSVATGGIVAASFAAGAVDSAAIATDAVTEIQSGLATAAVLATVQADTDDIQARLPAALVGGRISAAVGTVASGAIVSASFAAGALDAVWSTTDRLLTAGTNISLAKGTGITGFNDLSAAQANAEADAALADAGVTTVVTGRIDVAVSTRLATAGYVAPDNATITAIAGYLDTEIAAIKVVTDKLDDTLEDDGGTYRFTLDSLEQAPTGGSAPSAAVIADAVWDEARVGHVVAGTFGEGVELSPDSVTDVQTGLASAAALAAVQSDTDNIQTRLPAALVSGRMDANAQATAAALTFNLTGNLSGSVGSVTGSVGSVVGLTAANLDVAVSGRASAADLATVAGYLDTEVAAIKAKTDNLPADPAAASGTPTALQNADALLDRSDAVETGLTPRQALRLSAAAVAGKLSGGATATNTIRNAVADTKDRMIATVDEDGNRTDIVYNLT